MGTRCGNLPTLPVENFPDKALGDIPGGPWIFMDVGIHTHVAGCSGNTQQL